MQVYFAEAGVRERPPSTTELLALSFHVDMFLRARRMRVFVGVPIWSVSRGRQDAT